MYLYKTENELQKRNVQKLIKINHKNNNNIKTKIFLTVK